MEVCQQKLAIITVSRFTDTNGSEQIAALFRVGTVLRNFSYTFHIPKLDKIDETNRLSVLQYNLFFFTCLLVINATSDNTKYQLQDC